MKVTLNLIVAILIMFILMGCNSGQPVPTDVEMIEHFKKHEILFEELCSMIENDSLRHYPLFAQEIRDSIPLAISAERASEYDSLMKVIQIKSFLGYSNHINSERESILFFYFEKGDATWGIEKGFEYVLDRSKEDNKEFTEMELYDLAIEKRENCFLYKKINEKWNLFLFYDR